MVCLMQLLGAGSTRLGSLPEAGADGADGGAATPPGARARATAEGLGGSNRTRDVAIDITNPNRNPIPSATTTAVPSNRHHNPNFSGFDAILSSQFIIDTALAQVAPSEARYDFSSHLTGIERLPFQVTPLY